VGADTQKRLDEAHQNGLTVALGIWLGHERVGFDYNSADMVAQQYEYVREAVLRYKDHPAVLMWGLGNEMEGYHDGNNAAVWSHIQAVAAMVKKLDPHHPTMTVIAEVGGGRVRNIHRLCPDIDIIGVNTYAGAMSLPPRYRAAGGTKPYILTEFGPSGTWEIKKNDWGAAPEPTSQQKAQTYRQAYLQAVEVERGKLCLGSYAFTWGFKQESTATWYGMFLSDGSKLAAVDMMSELWTGQAPADRCPTIEPIALEGPDQVDPGATVRARVSVSDPEGRPVQIRWLLAAEAKRYRLGGEHEPELPSYPEAIVRAEGEEVELRMPQEPGGYRLFAFAYDSSGGAAMANLPLLVKGQEPWQVGVNNAGALGASLPMTLYGDHVARPPYSPSGYMGQTKAIAMDAQCTHQPHSGSTCLKVTYDSPIEWGGVAWLSPANDWGDQPGGYDLRGASALRFWARGELGGEVVSFGMGGLSKDKPYHDTATDQLEVKLTPEWKEYRVPMTDKQLARIKTGFVWALAGQGRPVTFYLDDIVYEGKGKTPNSRASLVGSFPGKAAALPLHVYGEAARDRPYAPTGWMGQTWAMRVTPTYVQPREGGQCLEVNYEQLDGWAGVQWQSPGNDWGDRPGGYDLTGASRLTFWARGAEGGEKVTFGYGGIARDKPFYDTAQDKIEVTLSTEWTQYRLDVLNKDLTRIKTGFGWVINGQGRPIRFYVDDVEFR
jgi:hypothetical protein